MRNRIGADVDSFFQTASQFPLGVTLIRALAKTHLFERALHSPRGLLPPLRTPHKSTTPHVCLEKNKNFDPQPPGLMWHMRVQGRDVELEREFFGIPQTLRRA